MHGYGRPAAEVEPARGFIADRYPEKDTIELDLSPMNVPVSMLTPNRWIRSIASVSILFTLRLEGLAPLSCVNLLVFSFRTPLSSAQIPC